MVLARFGYGAESIIEMKAVLADGNIVTVSPDKTIFADGRYVKLKGTDDGISCDPPYLYNIYKNTLHLYNSIYVTTHMITINCFLENKGYLKYPYFSNILISQISLTL